MEFQKYGCKGEPRFADEAMGVAMTPSWVNG